MSQLFQTARNSADILKKMAVGWLLIAGMVAYTLLAGCKQIYDWATARTEQATPPVGGNGSDHRPKTLSSEPTNSTTDS